jgi:hypothetical protein
MKLSNQMQAMLEFAQKRERMILDRTPSIIPAYMYANAVVSLFPSSIVMDALFLDLPVFVLSWDGSDSARDNYSKNPFYNAIAHEDLARPLPEQGSDTESMRAYIERRIFAPLDVFLREIETGEDPKREARAGFRALEFPNTDGTVAEKILEYMKAKLTGN